VKQYVSLAVLAPIIAAQYERADGWGMPNGLQAPEIPTTTYVVAIAEALDTLVYPPFGTLPASIDAICNTLLAGAGCRWDAGTATLTAQLISGSAASSLDLAVTNGYVDDHFLVA
jgi:response regulator RpfG family c-di-GMP phosphodiesterase